MKIISHRGFWQTPEEKNAISAFDRTVADGFGTETDVRDFLGDLVISHDPAVGNPIPWSAVVDRFDGTGLELAVNVKADGLSSALAASFAGRNVHWFAFDMSGPEMWRYKNAGLPYYTRHSDIEPDPILYGDAAGVWLDAFEDTWFDAEVITSHLESGKSVCVVSSELHGRDPLLLWQMLKPVRDRNGLTICTDKPLDVRRFLFDD
ncbi:hypothetical protein [Ensifer sp. Root278]|uniref:hypothetical protein n=1 Tax=Ensifer sp. Root278 TaxID=1736509 RepID=UPI0007109301|nr:hypothetical protein [Ensifer sp. Root278]KRD63441.1 hypothetical protein ASE60_31360 [Ensifer sp. Root278]